MNKIGFIGTGVMGVSMVRNLMKSGFELYVYTRTKAKAEALMAEGAIWCNSIEECAKGKNAVITIVGYPKDVRQVYFGENGIKGIIDSADKGTYLIDMTTSTPALAQEIAKAADEKGLHALDAPVSGGDSGAKNATLSIMVGGKAEDYNACMPIFEAMGKNINFLGINGNGQIAKAANQLAIAGALAGVAESLSFAKACGVDPEKVLECIKSGAAGSWQMSNNGPRMLSGDKSAWFYTKHYVKDLKIIEEKAAMAGIELPMFAKVLEIFCQVENEGYGDVGTQSIMYYYNKEEK